MLKSFLKLSAVMASVLWLSTPAQARVELGVLDCTIEGGWGLLIGSSKDAICEFRPAGSNPVETYTGTVNRLGIDIGKTDKALMTWVVFGPANEYPERALAGTYGGLAADASVGAGVGAKALVGGFQNAIILQPLSVQAQQGVNLAVGIGTLTLR